ncbi:MAG: Lsr2 family protein [Nocardioides sp.]|nr:Lsr2 family protein [Nocardioides sp.]
MVGDKLSKARTHGTRIVPPREFDVLLANLLQPTLDMAPPAPSPVGRSKKAESAREQHVSADERPPTPPPHSAPRPADVREWALENGISVAERGRLSTSLVERYLAAQEQASPNAQ